jgi:tetratricopeptide (TPR) repeat protein
VSDVVALHQAGHHAAALAQIAALQHEPRLDSVCCTLLGLIALASDALGEALAWFDRALYLDPSMIRAQLGRAEALTELKDYAAADDAFNVAFAMGCQEASAHYAHGNMLVLAGQSDAAIAAYDRALRLKPAYPEVLRAGAALLRARGQKAEALRFLAEAVRLNPNYLDGILDYSALLDEMNQPQAALAVLDQGLVALPNNLHLLNNKGGVLYHLGRLQEAIATLDTAILIDPTFAPAYLNKGEALIRCGRHEDALTVLDLALARRPNYVKALCARGIALKLLARFDEAGAAFDAALRADPTCVYARTNRGELRLLLGDFAAWGDYDARFSTRGHDRPVLGWPVKEWAGEANPGSVLVFADQAAGDVLHFARYIPVLRAVGAKITLVCRPRLQRLLRPVSAGCHVIDYVPTQGDFAYQIPLSNMPYACASVPETIPPAPYFRAEDHLVKVWRERIGSSGFRIGLCWRGSQDWRSDPKRSVPLEALRPLAKIPGIRLLSLQMADNLGPDLKTYEEMGIESITPPLDQGPDGFIDTAAVMVGLDLIVTCDTSIAHLAGGLGCPTFVLLQLVPEWRFLLEREDSPWYKSMRLFRQIVQDDWSTPVARLCEAIQTEVCQKQRGLFPAE